MLREISPSSFFDPAPPSFALCVDEDSELQQFMSPRTNPNMSFEARLDELVKVFTAHQKKVANLGVALTVEELCPGGLDPTDGIAIAQRLERAGAAFIIASGGTRDFPALKWRRPTQLREEHEDGMAWLASPLWLIGKVSIPVVAQGPVKDFEHTAKIAKQMGFSGLIQSPTINPSTDI